MRKGAILCGYQGVGKSSIAGNGYIDLESSNFRVNNERPENWYIIYSEIAIDLARQGYRVLLSAHKEVRDYLSEHVNPKEIRLCTISPSIDLKDKWIKRLKDRYEETGTNKDWAAFLNADSAFEKNVKDLQTSEGFTPLIITTDAYDLKDFLRDKFLYLDITD